MHSFLVNKKFFALDQVVRMMILSRQHRQMEVEIFLFPWSHTQVGARWNSAQHKVRAQVPSKGDPSMKSYKHLRMTFHGPNTKSSTRNRRVTSVDPKFISTWENPIPGINIVLEPSGPKPGATDSAVSAFGKHESLQGIVDLFFAANYDRQGWQWVAINGK